MDAIKDMIRPELLVLIPVLYFIGVGLKNAATVSDTKIPIFLGLIGIVLSLLYVMANTPILNGTDFLQIVFVGVTQGVLCAGCSVYINQLIKQNGKDDSV